MNDRELMQMALDALESWQKTCLDCGRASEELGRSTKPIKALRDRLAQPKRQWVGLTDEDKSLLVQKYKHIETGTQHDENLITEAEAKLKEKNT
jgi:hypothetical protein